MKAVAIDGFTGSGKSTLAKILAQKLGFHILDTGTIFRAMAYGYLQSGLGEIDEKKAEKYIKTAKVEVDFIKNEQHTYLNGKDVTAYLRTEDVSQMASKISAFPRVREQYLTIAKNFAENYDCVMEGRDIGTVVIPNAQVKIFLTADENVRAKRRYEQQREMGNDVEFDDVLEELRARDYADVHREHGAITKLPESIVIDTTKQSLKQSVDFCLNEMRKRGFKQ